MSEPQHESPSLLLAAHQRRILGFLRTMIPNRDDAEEVLQDVNLYLCLHADEFRPGTDYTAWALQVAQFSALTWRGRQQRERLVFDDALVERLAEAGQRVSSHEDRRYHALQQCLQKLKSDEHSLVIGYYEDIGQIPATDIAVEAGKSPSGIYVLLKRIRLKLLKCIESTLAAEDHPKPAPLPEGDKDPKA